MTPSTRPIKRLRPLLGTWVEIELSGRAGETLLQRAISRGFAAIETIDRLMSPHRPTSELSRLNRAPEGRWLRLHPQTISVLSAIQTLYEQSGGIFDARTGGGFRRRPLDIIGRRVRKTGPWTFDLGGIAKGFAVDCAYERIQRALAGRRIAGAINAGGDLRLWGKKRLPAAVRILTPEASIVKRFMTAPGAIATSTCRTRPRAGYTRVNYPSAGATSPTEKTATVFARRCLWADALTKIVLLGSPETARRCLTLHAARAVVHRADGGIAEVFS